MKPLDQVVRDHMAPVLKDAGFRRKGRYFWRENAQGDMAMVDVRSFTLGANDAEFIVGLGVQPKVWDDFLTRNGGAGRRSLWGDQLIVPGRSDATPELWSFDLDDAASAAVLSASLSARLPELLSLLDPATLLAYAKTPQHAGKKIVTRPEIAQVALLAELGPSDELEQWLDALSLDRGDGWAEFDGEFVGFIRQWLASRQPGGAQN